MKTLGAFATLFAAATCIPWNLPEQVQDTPEVAAAKAAHFAVHARAKQNARENSSPINVHTNTGSKSNTEQQGLWKGNWEDKSSSNKIVDRQNENDDGSWKDDDSWMNYDDGSWKDKAEDTSTPNSLRKLEGTDMKWTGPVALPPGYDEFGAPLQVEDTPEVAAAKARHLQLYAQVASKVSSPPYTPAISAIPTKAFTPSPRMAFARISATYPAVSAGPVQVLTPSTRLASDRVPAADRHPAIPRTVPLRPAPVFEVDDGLQNTRVVVAAKAAYYTALANSLS